MSGPLANYQPRRERETIIARNSKDRYQDLETKEDCLFWFRQRILGYGANVRILQPLWLVNQFRDILQQACSQYRQQIDNSPSPNATESRRHHY